MPADGEQPDIGTAVALEAEGDAAIPASESTESSPAGEEDSVKVAEAAPEPVDTAIEPATTLPATATVVVVSVSVELAEAPVAGECDEDVFFPGLGTMTTKIFRKWVRKVLCAIGLAADGCHQHSSTAHVKA